MLITKGFKVRLYPNQEQEQYFLTTIGACRWVYNYFLEEKQAYYTEHKETLTYCDTSRILTVLRREIDWLSEVQHNPLQNSLRQLDQAYSSFFRKNARLPKFKSKKAPKQSFQKSSGWRVEGNRIRITKNISVRFRGNLPDNKMGALTVSKTADGRWYATTISKFEVAESKLRGAIGIDLGLNDLAITSSGDFYPSIPLLDTRKESRALSRTKKDSKARQKARVVLARKHNKIANIRKNYLHQISKAITSKNHAVVAVEKLAVKNMLRNHRLAKSIANASWGELLRQLEYKQRWLGGEFITVDRFFPSSKTCSGCQYILEDLSLSVREWDCPNCDTHHNRDVNAAINILQQAGEQLGVEAMQLFGLRNSDTLRRDSKNSIKRLQEAL